MTCQEIHHLLWISLLAFSLIIRKDHSSSRRFQSLLWDHRAANCRPLQVDYLRSRLRPKLPEEEYPNSVSSYPCHPWRSDTRCPPDQTMTSCWPPLPARNIMGNTQQHRPCPCLLNPGQAGFCTANLTTHHRNRLLSIREGMRHLLV
jgi:hypothetical protein